MIESGADVADSGADVPVRVVELSRRRLVVLDHDPERFSELVIVFGLALMLRHLGCGSCRT